MLDEQRRKAAALAEAEWRATFVPLEPHVVDGTDRHQRLFDHHRALGQIDNRHVIDGVGVGREKQRVRVHRLWENDDGVVICRDAEKPLPDGVGGGAAVAVEEGIRTTGCLDLFRRLWRSGRRP